MYFTEKQKDKNSVYFFKKKYLLLLFGGIKKICIFVKKKSLWKIHNNQK